MPMPLASVTILLTGLSLINNSTYNTKTNRAADVLILQRAHSALSNYYDGATVHKHVGFLRFDIADWKSTTDSGAPNRQPQARVTIDGVEYGILFLTGGVTITPRYDLVAAIKPASKPVCKDESPDPSPSLDIDQPLCTPKSSREPACVPKLRTVCPGCDQRLDLNSPTIAAKFRVLQGRLTVDPSEEDRALWCMEGQPAFRGCSILPQQVRLRNDSATTITFVLDDCDPPLVLVPPPAQGILVMMGSAPIEEVLDLHDRHQNVDHHFELYYDLVDGEVPDHPPIPHKVKSGRDELSATGVTPLFGHGANCPPLIVR